MAASLRRACADVGAPLGLVLEGGYSLEALCGSVAALVPVLAAESLPAVRRAWRSTRWPTRAVERMSALVAGAGSGRHRVAHVGWRGARWFVQLHRRRVRGADSAKAPRTT